MAVSPVARRAFALFLLAFGVAMAIAALADNDWVSQKDQAGQYGTYKIGLTTWSVVDRDEATYGGPCSDIDLEHENAHDLACQWSTSLLGPRNDWRSAGEGALGIGCIAVIVQGFALIFNIVNLATDNLSKKPAAFLAFFSGVAYFIGALVYEGMRPSWGGDMGYNYPIGLYMAAGLMAEIATVALWSADGQREFANAKGRSDNNGDNFVNVRGH